MPDSGQVDQMSIYGLEDALWQASTNPKYARRLREDSTAYLEEFRVEENERMLLAAWDVRGLVEMGVNPMVLMMANAAVNGPDASASYIEKVNTPTIEDPSRGSSHG